MEFAINHMTAPGLQWSGLLELARELGCAGVEFRNDLPTELFSGEKPEHVGTETRRNGLRILGLSQVYPFNVWTDKTQREVAELISTAKSCGAETISLIPRNDGIGTSEAQEDLRLALKEIKPMLSEAGLVGLVEPLGFERSSLRYKADTIAAIEAIGGQDEFRIVHDTFHHCLAGEREIFPDWTGIVHISGVTNPSLSPQDMEDEHRVLVDVNDRLGNVAQLRALLDAGYDGAVSFEAFSPDVHAVADPAPELLASIKFIKSQLDF